MNHLKEIGDFDEEHGVVKSTTTTSNMRGGTEEEGRQHIQHDSSKIYIPKEQ
jgi:hypothetical protein